MTAERQRRHVSDIGHADRLSQRADHPAVRRMQVTGDLDAVSPESNAKLKESQKIETTPDSSFQPFKGSRS
ncbi:MAG: hypothetical protein R3F31_02060 [Verrucomicrobiales bacterium]